MFFLGLIPIIQLKLAGYTGSYKMFDLASLAIYV